MSRSQTSYNNVVHQKEESDINFTAAPKSAGGLQNTVPSLLTIALLGM